MIKLLEPSPPGSSNPVTFSISPPKIPTTPVLKTVIQDSYSRLIAPSVEREIRSELTDKAQEGAIRVFGKKIGVKIRIAGVGSMKVGAVCGQKCDSNWLFLETHQG